MTETWKHVADTGAGLEMEAELFSAQETGACLWSAAQPAVVCPGAYKNHHGFEKAAAASAERGWPVLTRPTGGGAVPQGPGVINLAMAITVDTGFTIEDGYRLITRPIRNRLEQEGLQTATGTTPGSFCDGAWNLSISGQKVVGTAQRWRLCLKKGSAYSHMR